MFEDLKPEITKEDLKDKIKEMKIVLKKSRDFVIDQQKQIDTLKNDFDEVKTDAGRFAKHIKDLHDRIVNEGIENIFQDLEVPE